MTFTEAETRRYRSRGWWSGVTIPELLERQAGLRPDKTALVAGPARWTYNQLLRSVRRAALAFAGLGLGGGDRVLLQLPDEARQRGVRHAAEEIKAARPQGFEETGRRG